MYFKIVNKHFIVNYMNIISFKWSFKFQYFSPFFRSVFCLLKCCDVLNYFTSHFSINSNHHHKTDTYLHFTTMNNCYHETIFLTRTTCTFPHAFEEEKHNNIFSHFLTLTTESCFCTHGDCEGFIDTAKSIFLQI